LGLVATLFLLLPFAGFAQRSARSQGPYQSVEIVVKDLATNREVGVIRPGGSITLTEGQKVRLIMTAIRSGRGQDPYYPETEFTEAQTGHGWVRLTRTSVENANATVEIVRPSSDRDRTETLRYRILETAGIPHALRQGAITIRVQPIVSSEYPPATSGSRTAEEITNSLYRAILLRDMDPSGQSYADRIARSGYPELLRIADEIARSEESRRISVSPEQRLAALYQNLLGLNSSQADQNQWRDDLSRLRSGRFADVVSDIVRSERFQDFQNLS
jgi:hypothetical protein